jgi:hypothetical protein
MEPRNVYAGMTFDLGGRLAGLVNDNNVRPPWANYVKTAFVQFVSLTEPGLNFWETGFARQSRLVAKFRPKLNYFGTFARA